MIICTLIQTARLNGVDPQAWLADLLARVNDHAITDFGGLVAMALGGHDGGP